jgi:phage terminase small subunit
MTGTTTEPDALTELQRRFVEEMLLDPTSATRAYIKAGGKGTEGSSARQQAARLMADGGVARALDAARRERSARMWIDADWVLNKLVQVVERCMQGQQVLDEEGIPTGEWKFDPAGATRALHLLMKHLGMFERDNRQKEGTQEEYEAAMARLRQMGYEPDKHRALPGTRG